MAKRARGSGNLPTGRELAWFAGWTALVFALVFFARRYLSWETADRERSDEKRSIVEVRLASDIEQDALASLPVLRSAKQALKPRQASAQSREGSSYAKRGWSPDASETPGDARRIHPEEVKWLQERLNAVEPKFRLPESDAYDVIRRIVQRVGDIPYAAQTHGWGLPDDTLRRNQGDCADKSLLLAELLLEIGVEEVALCIGVPEGYKPGEAGHAWVQAMIGEQLWRLESTSGKMRKANTDGTLDRYEPVATIWRTGAAD